MQCTVLEEVIWHAETRRSRSLACQPGVNGNAEMTAMGFAPPGSGTTATLLPPARSPVVKRLILSVCTNTRRSAYHLRVSACQILALPENEAPARNMEASASDRAGDPDLLAAIGRRGTGEIREFADRFEAAELQEIGHLLPREPAHGPGGVLAGDDGASCVHASKRRFSSTVCIIGSTTRDVMVRRMRWPELDRAPRGTVAAPDRCQTAARTSDRRDRGSDGRRAPDAGGCSEGQRAARPEDQMLKGPRGTMT